MAEGQQESVGRWKPVGHNVSEGRRLVQAARKHGRICQVGTQYRSDATCRAAARFLAEGKLGKVTLARSFTQSGDIPGKLERARKAWEEIKPGLPPQYRKDPP